MSAAADPLRAGWERSAQAGVAWSVLVLDAASGVELLSRDPDRVLRTASLGKLLLLIEIARHLEEGTLDAEELLTRSEHTRVGDSGLWQHLDVTQLAVSDLARLVGRVSDNWATNVLLERIGGVGAIRELPQSADVVLRDRVRDIRTPDDPPTLSEGSARGYVTLLSALHAGTLVDTAVSARVFGWLRGGLDLSMVAGAFGLDPLAHDEPDRGFSVVNKTGTDLGIRADVGIVETPRGAWIYACLANVEAGDDARRDEVLALMREVGKRVRAGAS